MNKQQMEQLAAALPPLRFSLADQEFSRSTIAQLYLDFYGINFQKEMPSIMHGFGCIDSGGFNIAAHYWRPQVVTDKNLGTLFLVHGYYDHAGLYGAIIRAALEYGYAVVIFDLPGHGLSSGPPAAIECFTQYTQALEVIIERGRDALPKPWSIVGQSTGAAIVLDHHWRCRENSVSNPFKKTVLLAPLIRPYGWKQLGWLLPLLKVLFKKFNRHYAASSHNQKFLDFIATKDPLQAQSLPVVWISAVKKWQDRIQVVSPMSSFLCIIQGDTDNTVDWRFNLNFLQEKFPDHLCIKIIEGAAHHLVCESDPLRVEVFDQMFDYLKGRMDFKKIAKL